MRSVEEYARWRGISVQRVRELLRRGELPGHRVGERQWAVDDAAFLVRPHRGQPMAPATAWAFIALLSGEAPHVDVPHVRNDRLKSALRRLKDADQHAPALLASWLRRRGDRLVYRLRADDLHELREDTRLMLSGVSDPRAGMAEGDVAEVWLRDWSKLSELEGDYLLLPDIRGNVIVHRSGLEQHAELAPVGLVMADLADWNQPREDARVVELLAEMA